jgi:hypothetical protein
MNSYERFLRLCKTFAAAPTAELEEKLYEEIVRYRKNYNARRVIPAKLEGYSWTREELRWVFSKPDGAAVAVVYEGSSEQSLIGIVGSNAARYAQNVHEAMSKVEQILGEE